MLRVKLFYLFSLFTLYSPGVFAQEDVSHRSGQYEIFYSVLNTSFLTPEVASAAGIVRAKNRGLLNISVVEHVADSDNKASTRTVALHQLEAELFDLVHTRKLVFNEVVEPGARYYLATFKISNDNETMVFRVRLQPENSGETIAFEFKRALYID